MTIGVQPIGFLVAESATPGLFDTSHVERLAVVADQTAAAISNARLFERTAEMAAVDERQRLARDLHDSVSQTLWTASLLAGTLSEQDFADDDIAQQVSEIRTLTRGAVAEMRMLLLELRPRALEDASIHDLLDQLLAGLESRKDLIVESSLDPAEGIPDIKLGLYRIAQEALNNIGRHAAASRVSVRFEARPRSLILTIRDDGVGFDAAEALVVMDLLMPGMGGGGGHGASSRDVRFAGSGPHELRGQ